MKRILSLAVIAAMVTFAIVSCKDDFSEEDFLRLQSELKLKQDEVMRQRNDSTSKEAVQSYINAANEAGDLLSVSIIVRENGNPLPGVTVALSSGTTNEVSSGRTKAVTTGVTDATGNVVFDRVTIGSGTATFSKTGFVGATATYDFSSLALAPIPVQVPNPNGNGTYTYYITPAKRFEEAAVEMLSASPSEGSTATIKGRVTIENDLTNLTSEVPTGIVLRANLTNLLNNKPQGFFQTYTLADNSNLGRATIATDGTYTMVVPAAATSSTISFIIPNIEGPCRIAVNKYDGVILPTPEYRNVPTSWGPSITNDGSVPSVVGARVVVPTAPGAGSGLSFSVAPVARSLELVTISGSEPTNLNGGNIYYRIANRGSFSVPATPSVTISGGGGSGATATATIQSLIKALTVSNRGSGYGAQVTLQFRIHFPGDISNVLSQVAVNTVDNGKLPEFMSLENIDANGFGTDDTPVTIATNTDAIGLSVSIVGSGSDAAVTPTFVTDLKQIQITNAGGGYTSKPTITVNGGTGTLVEIIQFPVFWDITPVMGAGTDYAILPDFSISYPAMHSQFGSSSANVDSYHQNGTLDAGGVALRSQLTIVNGDVVPKFPRNFKSTIQSHGQPSVTIITETPQNAKFVFSANAINATTGAIIGIPSLPTLADAGNGYNFRLTGQIVPAATGAPGSGAAIDFKYDTDGNGNDDDFNPVSLEWQFEHDTDGNPNTISPNNLSITAQGTGYLPNLNQYTIATRALPLSVDVQAGKTYTVNFAYENGKTSVKVE